MVERQAIQLHSVTNEYVVQYPIFPHETVREIFQRKKFEWEASSAGQQLQSTLKSIAIPDVRKIVAFACFNMSDRIMAERSACQHALILILKEFFAKQQNPAGNILCFAQDPLYEDVDRQILADAGVTVLENPRAFLEVDDTTLVFSLSPETPVRQIVADLARSAVMIWNKVAENQRMTASVGQTEW